MSMTVTRLDEGTALEVPGHVNVQPLAVFGEPAAPSEAFTVIYSHYLPGGLAEESVVPAETVYIVTAGELTFTSGGEDVSLGVMDAVRMTAGTVRTVTNRTTRPASMIVVRATA